MSKSLFPNSRVAQTDPRFMSRLDIIMKAAEVGAEGVYAIECGKPDPTVTFENGQMKFVPFLGMITQSVNPKNPYRRCTINTGVGEIDLTVEEEAHLQALIKKYLKELRHQADDPIHV